MNFRKIYPVLGILLAFTALGVDVVGEHLGLPLAVAIFVFFMTAIFQLADIKDASDSGIKNFQRYVHKIGEDVKDTVRSSQDFYDEGNALTIGPKLETQLKQAILVKNVFAPFPRAQDAPYRIDSPHRLKAFELFFENPRSYSLVEVVPLEIALSPEGREYREKMLELARSAPTGKDSNGWLKKEYSLLVLDRPVPIINFIILYYEDSTRELFFGWGGFGSSSPAKVYSSKEPTAIQMFEDYFETLLRMSGRLEDSHSLAFRLQRCLGYWIDIAFDVEQIGPTSNEIVRKPANCGVISFELDEDGRLFTRGVTFKIEDGKVKNKIHSAFRSTSCEIKRNKIFVSHDTMQNQDSPENQSSGKTTYDFKHFKTVQRLRGTILSYRKTRKSGRFLETIGQKVSVDNANKLDKAWGDYSQIYSVIDEDAKELLKEARTLIDSAQEIDESNMD